MEIVIIVAVAVVAFAGGNAFQWYWRKRDPAKLQAWADAAKLAGQKVEDKIKEATGK